jgi:ketosteroid isomerase-like protein
MTKTDNETLLRGFYEAFQARDGEGMARCYAPNATFSDPVFVGLEGEEPGDMWRMLCSRAADLRVEFSDVTADDGQGSAHWEAWYTFSATGKKVHNVIEARFRFADGRIVEHVDTFDLRRWMAQALGAKGLLLGWLPPVQNAVRKQARAGLAAYQRKHRE